MRRLPISEAPQDGTPILTKIDGQWMILRWYDYVDSSGYVETTTYAPAWIDGSRDTSYSRNHFDRLNTFDPEFFYHLPEED